MDVTKLSVGYPCEEQENDWRISLYREENKRPVIIICGETEQEVRQRTAGLILALEGYHVARQMVSDLTNLPSEHQSEIFDGLKDVEQDKGLETISPQKSIAQAAIRRAMIQAKESINSEIDNIP